MPSKLKLFRKPPPKAKRAATEAKPKANPPSQTEVLVARIGALLEENNELVRQLAAARAEHDRLERSQPKQKELHTMATAPVNLGEVIQYQPADPSAAPVAALVIGVHEDGTSDLKTFLGYCLGMADVEKVAFADHAEPGKASKLGAKPKDAPTPKPKSEAK